jgi:paraquat-inducible protein B
MARKASPAATGAFVLGAVALAIIGLAVLGSGRLFQSARRYVLFFDGSVNGLSVGAAVKLNGVQVGTVDRVLLAFGPEMKRPRIPVVIAIDRDRLEEEEDLGLGSFTGSAKQVQELIERGLRGQLQSQSLVTGILFVELTMRPGTRARLVKFNPTGYPQIPTMPNTLQQATKVLNEVLTELEKVDFEQLFTSIRKAVQGIDDLANSPELRSALASLDEMMQHVKRVAITIDEHASPMMQSLRRASESASAAFEDLGRTTTKLDDLIDPESPLLVHLEQSLAELERAARAVQQLASSLERDPSALLYGKPRPEENP